MPSAKRSRPKVLLSQHVQTLREDSAKGSARTSVHGVHKLCMGLRVSRQHRPCKFPGSCPYWETLPSSLPPFSESHAPAHAQRLAPASVHLFSRPQYRKPVTVSTSKTLSLVSDTATFASGLVNPIGPGSQVTWKAFGPRGGGAGAGAGTEHLQFLTFPQGRALTPLLGAEQLGVPGCLFSGLIKSGMNPWASWMGSLWGAGTGGGKDPA